MRRLITILLFIGMSDAISSDCMVDFDYSLFVARPLEMARYKRYKQIPVYRTREEFLNEIFGEHDWSKTNNKILLSAPDIVETSETVPVSTNLSEPIIEKGTIYWFAEYKHNNTVKIEQLSKIKFYRKISLYSSRYKIPSHATIFAIIHDAENNNFHISKNVFVKVYVGICTGVSVATEDEADVLNRGLCKEVFYDNKVHAACLKW